ncbi:hypothetical protein BDM02DRAFT_3120960 [Thelephora ganbajun]|uniref:Uncharacterized protein n=1 Tax=Thelephora ganbajun TaxID=370292 RepID=A0ACB6Z5W7_THEGA|nr:hypothetical protein BDM02DRAFT_3120960 [Thelephora ganbajun]
MVVLADEVLESFFDQDFSGTFRLELTPLDELPTSSSGSSAGCGHPSRPTTTRGFSTSYRTRSDGRLENTRLNICQRSVGTPLWKNPRLAQVC